MAKKEKVGIVMMNMGGPRTLNKVQNFLTNLFCDYEIIPLPFQKWLGPLIAKRRTPAITKQYAAIGGGSPIGDWTEKQGKALCSLLNKNRPEVY